MTGRLLLSEEPLSAGYAAVDQQQAGVLRDEREAVQTQVAFALKEGKVLVTQFIQNRSTYSLISVYRRPPRRSFYGRLTKTKQPSLLKRDEGCLKSSSTRHPNCRNAADTPAGAGALQRRAASGLFRRKLRGGVKMLCRNAFQPRAFSGRRHTSFWPHLAYLP